MALNACTAVVQTRDGTDVRVRRLQVRQRKTGNTAGTSDVYYKSPEGKRFRSRREVVTTLGLTPVAEGRRSGPAAGASAPRNPWTLSKHAAATAAGRSRSEMAAAAAALAAKSPLKFPVACVHGVVVHRSACVRRRTHSAAPFHVHACILPGPSAGPACSQRSRRRPQPACSVATCDPCPTGDPCCAPCCHAPRYPVRRPGRCRSWSMRAQLATAMLGGVHWRLSS